MKYENPYFPSIDKQNSLEVFLEFPKRCVSSIDLAKNIPIPKDAKGIALVGMGGSGVAGDFIKTICNPVSEIPFLSFKGGPLPKFIKKDWLVIHISFSGNTNETLDVLKQSIRLSRKICVVTNGGKMKEIAKKYNLPLVLIETCLHPRMALPELLLSTYSYLYNGNYVPPIKDEILKIIPSLEKISKDFLDHLTNKTEYLGIPQDIVKDKIIVYANQKYFTIGYRFKSQLNENSKALAWIGNFPEVCHNEIEGWNSSKLEKTSFKIIKIQEENHASEIPRNITNFLLLLKKLDIKYYIINIHGKSLIEKILATTYKLDLLSYFLAVKNNVDPSPVSGIEWLKKN
ncbi:MAG: SIS domain-containing protein [Candidatus Ranarchaeia archaeon]